MSIRSHAKRRLPRHGREDLPDNGTVFRDDAAGIGQLQAQLNNAQLTARLEGEVVRLDGTPVQTMEDLTTTF